MVAYDCWLMCLIHSEARASIDAMASRITLLKKGLEDLTVNSKPLIDDLTRAAGQLQPEGGNVVEIIQDHIMKVAGAMIELLHTHELAILLCLIVFLCCSCFHKVIFYSMLFDVMRSFVNEWFDQHRM